MSNITRLSFCCDLNYITSIFAREFTAIAPRQEAHGEIVQHHGFSTQQWHYVASKAMEIAINQYDDHHMILGVMNQSQLLFYIKQSTPDTDLKDCCFSTVDIM